MQSQEKLQRQSVVARILEERKLQEGSVTFSVELHPGKFSAVSSSLPVGTQVQLFLGPLWVDLIVNVILV